MLPESERLRTLADLYDRDTMPSELRRAHRAVDAAVEKLYRTAPFSGDRDRVEYLFSLYERRVAPLAPPTRPSRQKRRR